MKIAVITPIEEIKGLEENLESLGEWFYWPNVPKSVIKEFLMEPEKDVIFTNPNMQGYVLDKDVLEGTSIKWIVTASTGTNHIDLKYCEEVDIKVVSITKDYGLLDRISSTAELAFALMMNLIRNIPAATERVKNFQWEYITGRQLSEMSVGIVGYGRLGKMMTRYCQAFGAQVYIYDPYAEVPTDWTDHNQLVTGLHYPEQVASLKILFDLSDVISLHVHLNEETKYLIDGKLLKKFENKYLVNTSRGDIVNENDVLRALEMGNLLGYATDVIAHELGDVSESPLIKALHENDNLIITPHLGGSTSDAMSLAYNGVIDKFKKLYEKS